MKKLTTILLILISTSYYSQMNIDYDTTYPEGQMQYDLDLSRTYKAMSVSYSQDSFIVLAFGAAIAIIGDLNNRLEMKVGGLIVMGWFVPIKLSSIYLNKKSTKLKDKYKFD